MYSYFGIINKGDQTDDRKDFLGNKLINVIEKCNYSVTHSSTFMTVLSSSLKQKGIKNYYLSNNRGIIFGTLFKRNGCNMSVSVNEEIDDFESQMIIESSGEHLIDNYWGRYIAFLNDDNKGRCLIIRDPTGSIPAFIYNDGNRIIIFSSGDDFLKLITSESIIKEKLRFNRLHISSFIIMPVLDYSDSGIDQIHKIYPGEALIVDRATYQKKSLWNPSKFCNNIITEPRRAAEEMRQTILDCINSWAGQFDNIIHRLSGGLDSTIVLAGLTSKIKSSSVTALVYYSDGMNSDERRRARVAAEYFGVPIIEKEDIPSEVDITLVKDFIVSADPLACRFYLAKGAYEKKLAEKLNADCFFGGEGGDCIFASGVRYKVAEYVSQHGINLNLLKVIDHCSRVDDVSYWKTLLDAFRSWMSRPDWSPNRWLDEVPESLFTNDIESVLNLDDRFMHWLPEMRESPAAKKIHVSYTKMINYHRYPNHPMNEVPRINPLLSQPIIELVYRIPSYLFVHGGVDRGLARLAFKGMAPDENIMRVSKGGIHDFYQKLFFMNIGFLKEFYMDGMLVKHGIYKRDVIEKAFLRPNAQGNFLRGRLIDTIGAEVFMRRWSVVSA